MDFNFHSPRRIEVTEDMAAGSEWNRNDRIEVTTCMAFWVFLHCAEAMAFFIILLMIGVSTNLNQTLHKLVVQPMAGLLGFCFPNV